MASIHKLGDKTDRHEIYFSNDEVFVFVELNLLVLVFKYTFYHVNLHVPEPEPWLHVLSRARATSGLIYFHFRDIILSNYYFKYYFFYFF